MQTIKEKSTKTFEDLPETITPLDYAEWRGIGENKAREIFNSKDFPRIKGTGVKQIADKRAILLSFIRTDNKIITKIPSGNNTRSYFPHPFNSVLKKSRIFIT